MGLIRTGAGNMGRGDRMVDREKVISDLEEQITWIRDNDFHKFPGWGHAVLAMRDALALLKAQEPVKPKWEKGYAYCGKCGYKLHWIVDLNNFCPNCGQAVKWDG